MNLYEANVLSHGISGWYKHNYVNGYPYCFIYESNSSATVRIDYKWMNEETVFSQRRYEDRNQQFWVFLIDFKTK